MAATYNVGQSRAPIGLLTPVGPRSGMMVVAALCEKQVKQVSDIKGPVHDVLATGVRRAAARGGQLPGKKLSALLASDYWESLFELGAESKEFHRLPRGIRPRNQPLSSTLQVLNKTANELLARQQDTETQPRALHTGGTAMPYDIDVAQERYTYEGRQRHRNRVVHSKDLEAIVTLLEVAALSLTNEPDATFTLDRLVREAKEIGGEEIDIEEEDVKIVMEKATFFKKVGGEIRLR